jgi:hypothetical protein
VRFFAAFALVLMGLTVSVPVPVSAHHGDAVYDTTAKTITLKGTVTQWVWANPHCVLQFDVQKMARWRIGSRRPPHRPV